VTAPRGAGAPAAHRDARDTAALDGHEKDTATTSACGTSSATYRSRTPIPVLEAVRAQPDHIRRALEEHTERAESTGCLIWTGARNADGRGRITLRVGDRRVQYVVPRVVYALEHDVEPGRRLVLHGPCDRPECCAVEHLRLGTVAENVADMLERGRARIGEQHPRAKLREIDVEFIAARLATHTDAEIAAALGHIVCRRSIRCLRDGETWSHLTGIPRRTRRRAAAGGNR